MDTSNMTLEGFFLDKLNKSADEWNGSNMFELARMCREAADTIWELRDDLQRANAENAKLRESVRRLMTQRDERLARAEAENAKLRELVRMMLRAAGVAEYATNSEWQIIIEKEMAK